jgi:prefoldin subunit 5
MTPVCEQPSIRTPFSGTFSPIATGRGESGMTVVEEVRQVLQDFLAPEIRSIVARLDAVEKRMDLIDRRMDRLETKVDNLDKKLDETTLRLQKRMDDYEDRAAKRHEELMAAVRQIADYTTILQRLTRLEAKVE